MNTHDIELPAEFRSGNDIPVTVATIKRERMEEILRAAIEADRQRRGEPVAEVYRAHYGNRMGNIGVNAVRALVPPDDMPPPGTKLYAAPQPAEPVKVPSDEGIRDMATKAGVWVPLSGAERDLTTQALRRLIEDALIRYSQPAHPAASAEPVLCVSSADFKRLREADAHIKAWLPPATASEDMLLYAVPVAAQPSVPTPCDHIFEGRPMDGVRSASGPFTAVCRKCGYGPEPRAGQAQQATAAVTFVHELAMGAYRPEEIEARAKAIAKLAPLGVTAEEEEARAQMEKKNGSTL
ncbi:MAG TPA: hypothetical protein VNS29_03980 [Burkholderiaceae bacterium]|nr:hypothetical protein [Burkholderiaceae bacterium]